MDENQNLQKNLEAILKDDPSSKCFSTLAKIYLEQKEWKKAKELCERGLKHHPETPSAHYVLAKVASHEGKLEEAEKHIEKALEIDPNNATFYRELGDLHKKNKDIDKTLTSYQMAAKFNPLDTGLRKNIAHLEKVSRGEEKKETVFSSKKQKKLIKLKEILSKVDEELKKRQA